MPVPTPPITRDWIDQLRSVVAKVRWMTDRTAIGFKNIWLWLVGMTMILNDGQSRLFQGFYARLPGLGTPTALPLIGRSRGLLQGIGESDDDFALYCRGWLQLWQRAGQLQRLLEEVRHYCGGVKVKAFTRAGKMIQIDAAGVVTRATVTWDWDSKSNPENAGNWSEIFIVVYTPPWAKAPLLGPGLRVLGATGNGIGLDMPRKDFDALKSIFLDWKAARSRVNTVIFTYDATLFDPTTPATMPDGHFGRWSKIDPANPGHRIASRFANARYWHPQAYRHVGDTVG